MRISSEKLNALKARARNKGKSIAKTGKTTAIAAASGAAAYEVALHAFTKVEALRDKWWAPGAVLAVGGHLLRKKNEAVGIAVTAAGGTLLAMGYELNKSSTTTNNAPAPKNTSGYAHDAGALRARDVFASVRRSPPMFGYQTGRAAAPSSSTSHLMYL